MGKRLVLIAVAALSVVCSGIAEAKVCWLGDTSSDCTSVYTGLNVGHCSEDYKTCVNPRAGANYCIKDGQALYKEEDCCSNGYQECTGNKSTGYGESCLGVDNVRYWQSCGCVYGFIDRTETGTGTRIRGEEEDFDIEYDKRCGTYEINPNDECVIAVCNADRRWFSNPQNNGEWCQYRLPTRCGGYGCKQLFNCNNNINGREYYRNEDVELTAGVYNFIGFDRDDPLSNENINEAHPNAGDYYTDSYGNNVPYNNLVLGYDPNSAQYTTTNYELTNKIVCAYDGGNSCNGVEKYCYLFDELNRCNNDRGWFKGGLLEALNFSTIYYGDAAYEKWMKDVENNGDYKNSYGALLNAGNIKAINETFEYNQLHKTARNNFLAENSSYEKSNGAGSCIYITHQCHPKNNDRYCYKRIACDEGNGFYHSFINAANSKELYYAAFSGLENAALASPFEGINGTQHLANINTYKNLIYKKEYEDKDGVIGADGIPLVDLSNDQIDRYVYPACVYTIEACNDTPDGGEAGGGCYKFKECGAGFDTTATIPNIAEAWEPWFRDARPICNNLTRCYRATSCNPAVGAYSSVPNTSFFITGSSSASGSTCYRGMGCREEAGAYSSTPNTSFFFVIDSAASGSICYRGERCHTAAGAYSSSPNTSFFITVNSTASNSTCYRGTKCHEEAGAYSSTPNTSFFITVSSEASGSTAYRAERYHEEAGAYTSEPNTSFFFVIKSLASGSVAYRAEREHTEAGAYSSTPNTSFFITVSSEASGSTAYRAIEFNEAAGAYTSEPNTSFFFVIKSLASGSVAYRAQREHTEAGAYSSTPNTSFFITVSSEASGSTAYRAIEFNEAAGAYTSTPNTSFFFVIESLASGSVSYRAEREHTEAGAYSSTPNTSFFITVKSGASGSTCYRGIQCREADGGVYTASPNAEFFDVISSKASGSECYRAQGCGESQGSYSSSPNTSFFITIKSEASGSTCYRGNGCYKEAGAYSSTPNTSFFVTINSAATGLTCYRGEGCSEEAGAYTSTPNTVFFKVIESVASGSTCYRGERCAPTANAEANTSFFITVSSEASGSTCYRSTGCREDAGAYSSGPNTSFFIVEEITNAEQDSTCYRSTGCHIVAGAYSSTPNTSFFITNNSLSSGSTCYRGEKCNVIVGSYSSSPNTSFFAVVDSSASGSTCYRGENCGERAGAYSSEPNTLFFVTISSEASGSTCYRGTKCDEGKGSVIANNKDRLINTSFFVQTNSLASGSSCYRGDSCAILAGAYSSKPNIQFFNTINSVAPANSTACFRADKCNIGRGAYSSSPNTSFFITNRSLASGSICYRGAGCNIAAGVYTEAPHSQFFVEVHSSASGQTCYRGEKCKEEVGAYSSEPNTDFFKVIISTASGSICYRVDGGCSDSARRNESDINTSFFYLTKSEAGGITCYRGDTCHLAAGAYSSTPDISYFNTITSSSPTNSTRCYRADGCNTSGGAYSSTPNTSFFITTKATASNSTCYRGSRCNTESGAYSSSPNTSFFVTVNSKASGSTCHRGEKCNVAGGSYSSSPNTSFFAVADSSASGSRCYRGRSCGERAGAYSSEPNTLFFITISSKASGSTCYRGKQCNTAKGSVITNKDTLINTSFFVQTNSSASGSTCYRGDSCAVLAGAYSSTPNEQFFNTISSAAPANSTVCFRANKCKTVNGAYSSTPNTSFFITVSSKASGSTCYRGTGCHIVSGAYSSEPNTSFFITVSSKASGSTCHRGKSCNTRAGAYSSEPSTLYFVTISSEASGSTCYRSTDCNIAGGAYSSAPNTSFFWYTEKKSSSINCYRGLNCRLEAGAYESGSSPNTSYFVTISSKATGRTCYRAIGCHIAAGAYSSEPNTSFFATGKRDSSSSICYRGTNCRYGAGAYSSTPNTSFFITISSKASGSTCYRGTDCHIVAGAYSSAPNTLFFKTNKSSASGSICYRASGCKDNYAFNGVTGVPNTSYFKVTKSQASGSTCYRADSCNENAGAYSSSPNNCIFSTTSLPRTIENNYTFTCYRATGCVATTTNPNTCFFTTETANAYGYTCTYASGIKADYGSAPNTNVFTATTITTDITNEYVGNGCKTLTAYYASGCNTNNLWYASSSSALPSSNGSCYFTTTSETSKRCENIWDYNKTCYTVRPRTEKIEISNGSWHFSHWRNTEPQLTIGNAAYVFRDNNVTFEGGETSTTNHITYQLYYPIGCNEEYYWYSSAPNASYFNSTSRTANNAGHQCNTSITCNKATSGKCKKPSSNSSAFIYNDITTNGGNKVDTQEKLHSYVIDKCNETNKWYESITNTSYFAIGSTVSAGVSGNACGQKICHKAKCADGKLSTLPDNNYYEWKEGASATEYGITCGECECKWDANKCDTGYFKLKEDDKTRNECGTSQDDYCLVKGDINGDRCHLTFRDRCSGEQEILVYANTTRTVTADTEVDENGNDPDGVLGRICVDGVDGGYSTDVNSLAQYYLWGAPKKCGETIRRVPTGCNEAKYSYDDKYSSTSSSGYEMLDGSEALSSVGTSLTYDKVFNEKQFQDIQDLGFATECGKQCYVGCSCNHEQGWYESKVAAGITDPNAAYVGVRSVRQYAYATTIDENGNEVSVNAKQTCFHAVEETDPGYFCVNFKYTCSGVNGSQDCTEAELNKFKANNNVEIFWEMNENNGGTSSVVTPQSGETMFRKCYTNPGQGEDIYDIGYLHVTTDSAHVVRTSGIEINTEGDLNIEIEKDNNGNLRYLKENLSPVCEQRNESGDEELCTWKSMVNNEFTLQIDIVTDLNYFPRCIFFKAVCHGADMDTNECITGRPKLETEGCYDDNGVYHDRESADECNCYNENGDEISCPSQFANLSMLINNGDDYHDKKPEFFELEENERIYYVCDRPGNFVEKISAQAKVTGSPRDVIASTYYYVAGKEIPKEEQNGQLVLDESCYDAVPLSTSFGTVKNYTLATTQCYFNEKVNKSGDQFVTGGFYKPVVVDAKMTKQQGKPSDINYKASRFFLDIESGWKYTSGTYGWFFRWGLPRSIRLSSRIERGCFAAPYNNQVCVNNDCHTCLYYDTTKEGLDRCCYKRSLGGTDDVLPTGATIYEIFPGDRNIHLECPNGEPETFSKIELEGEMRGVFEAARSNYVIETEKVGDRWVTRTVPNEEPLYYGRVYDDYVWLINDMAVAETVTVSDDDENDGKFASCEMNGYFAEPQENLDCTLAGKTVHNMPCYICKEKYNYNVYYKLTLTGRYTYGSSSVPEHFIIDYSYSRNGEGAPGSENLSESLLTEDEDMDLFGKPQIKGMDKFDNYNFFGDDETFYDKGYSTDAYKEINTTLDFKEFKNNAYGTLLDMNIGDQCEEDKSSPYHIYRMPYYIAKACTEYPFTESSDSDKRGAIYIYMPDTGKVFDLKDKNEPFYTRVNRNAVRTNYYLDIEFNVSNPL